VRAGYVLNDAVLLYGRAGVVNSWFDNEYSFAGSDVDRTKSELGLRVGAGVEFALSNNVTMRLDYTRTDYGSYEVDYGSGVESFDNAENLFRVGISYRF
jgi:outer membrane autotransporter protein